MNTDTYCSVIPLIKSSVPDIHIYYDPNPNALSADCCTDVADFNVMSINWGRSNCDMANGFCGGADMTGDGNVDLQDLAVLAGLWLQ
ncbi:MAG: hypothetical protein JEZ07_16775 [Phycisphaerae bacterium]|nr:hypothetical protein [Phycisphaerae bacterium]